MRNIQLRYSIWFAYLAVIIIAGVFHEPWRDEIDTWVMSRYTSFYEFITYFSYSGHPPLWYLIHLPFSRLLELPVETQKIFPVIFAGALAWLLLFKSPFPLWIIIPLLFSVHFVYQHGVIARGYILMLLLMALVVNTHPIRFEKPILYSIFIALLYQTEVFAWSFAGTLTLFYLWDIARKKDRKLWLGFAIQMLSALLVIALLWPRSDASDTRDIGFTGHSFLGLFDDTWFPFLSFRHQIGYFFHFAYVDIPDWFFVFFLFYSLLLYGVFFYALRRSRSLLLAIACLGWFLFIFIFIYLGAFWHRSLIPFCIIFICWLAQQEGGVINHWMNRLLFLPLMVSCFVGVAAIGYDITQPYSGGKAAAKYIETHKTENTPLVIALGCESVKTVAAHLPESRFWMEVYGRFMHYQVWDRSYYDNCKKNEKDQLKEALNRFSAEKEFWVITEKEIEKYNHFNLQQMYYSKGLGRENIWIYKRISK